jgi:hypothetical protein
VLITPTAIAVSGILLVSDSDLSLQEVNKTKSKKARGWILLNEAIFMIRILLFQLVVWIKHAVKIAKASYFHKVPCFELKQN